MIPSGKAIFVWCKGLLMIKYSLASYRVLKGFEGILILDSQVEIFPIVLEEKNPNKSKRNKGTIRVVTWRLLWGVTFSYVRCLYIDMVQIRRRSNLRVVSKEQLYNRQTFKLFKGVLAEDSLGCGRKHCCTGPMVKCTPLIVLQASDATQKNVLKQKLNLWTRSSPWKLRMFYATRSQGS